MEFVCRVGAPDGRVLQEVRKAMDEAALRSDLEREGFHVFEVRRRGLPVQLRLPRWKGRRQRISMQELLVFNQELAALLKAGLPLLQALDLMLERLRMGLFKEVLEDVRDRVKAGEDLSEAFAAHGDLFPRLYSATLKAGERTGELEKVIRRFIRYQRLVLEARKRVVSALIYPAVLVALSVSMIVVMTIFVVPKFTGFFENMEVELPLLTQVTLGISVFAQRNAPWILVGLAVGFVALRQWQKTPAGHEAADRWKLRLPFLGQVLHNFSLAEFCRSLSTLLGGGLPLVPSLEIAVRSVGNAHIRSRLEPTIDRVREGKAFHAALEETGVVTEVSVDMVKVGEATGALDEMLANVGDFLDEQVETRMQRLLTLVEPLMLVFMGLLIAILLVSVYLPLFSALGNTSW